MIRANYPRSEFDGNADYKTDQSWRLLAYDWTDVNHDGRLWQDENGNGVVNHADKHHSSNIDGFNDIDFGKSEMEKGEYERFFYHRPGANTLMGFVGHPAQRMHDGVFLGFQHSAKAPAIDQTHFTVQIEYYKNVDWSWVTETQPVGGHFNASINVPAGTPYGMYDGALVASNGSDSMVVPVAVTVSATAAQDASGNFTQRAHVRQHEPGDRRRRERTEQLALQQRVVLRRERLDVAGGVRRLAVLLLRRADRAAGGDVVPHRHAVGRHRAVHGPRHARVRPVGGRLPVLVRFDTATGGSEDISTAPASEGLHGIADHGVGFQGDSFAVPFTTTVGSATVSPSHVEQSTADGTAPPAKSSGRRPGAQGRTMKSRSSDRRTASTRLGPRLAGAPPGDFILGEDIVQGSDLTISGVPSGAVPANTPVTLHVTYAKPSMVSGQSYKGEILLGPSVAPTAVSVPVTITRN